MLISWKLFVFLLILQDCHSSRPKVYHVSLDQSTSVTLDWIVNYGTENLLFEIHLPSDFGWFAFGFSDRGELFPADICLLWRNWKGKTYFQDTLANEHGVILLDEHQDCKNFKIQDDGETTKFYFQRKFDTCDPTDYIIEDGTTHIVWARGKGPIFKANGLNITSKDSGMVRVNLLKNINVEEDLPIYTEPLKVLTNNASIPYDDTTYWCHVFKLPPKFARKHHVYQYESTIQKENEGVVHHMEVFHCVAPMGQEIPEYVGSCFAPERPQATQICKRVLAAWAMGAPAFTYPKEAGLPIGGKDFNPYIMLEVHYNNPERKKGIVDSSGITFQVSSELKPMDAGVIELGLEYIDKMAIPPGQDSFSLSGYCVTECTSVSLPKTGITVFGSQLHTHLTGIQVKTRHIRNGRELPELDRDNHFSTHFQEIRRLKRPVVILPGDALITTCDYRTSTRSNITLGGFAISDEMCVNYIHYYPHTDLEVCKSAISDQALQTFFTYMKEWENQETDQEAISKNYDAIKWNKMRVELLQSVYQESPLSMQCNMSSGDRFPGYWENTPITPVLLPLPPKNRKCTNRY